MTPAITLASVTKTFGQVTAVDDLSFQVDKGRIYGFLGPNGSGKTTSLRMIMGIFYPDCGRITVLDRAGGEEVKSRLGYLPEERGLYKKMKVGEIITYFGTLKGLTHAVARRETAALLERYGMNSWQDRKCEALSKGMGQKVQLLSVLVHQPELMILDEPFSGLDPVNMELMRDAILQLKRDGKTVLFSTHVMSQAEELCDSILLIHKGKKILDGEISAVRSGGPRGIKVDYDGDGSFLPSLPGVKRVNDAGKTAEIFLHDGEDPQILLKMLLERGLCIRRFDLSEPSLHEIFVRAVGGKEGVCDE